MVLLAPTPFAAQGKPFDRRAWLQDFTILKVQLEYSYSNLAWFASPQGGIDLPALNRRALAALRNAHSDDDARSAILTFKSGFHDGHFSQLAPLDQQAASKVFEPAPFIYDRANPQAGCAALGYVAEGSTAFSLPFESLPDFRLISDGEQQPFRAGIVGTDGQAIGVLRIGSFRSNPYPSLCLSTWKSDVWKTDGQLSVSELRHRIDSAWYEAIASLLRGFQEAHVAAVLVDVGNNSGGNDSGDIAARLFTGKPMHSAQLLMSQDITASKPYFDELADDLKQAASMHPNPAETAQIQNASSSLASERAKLDQACPMNWAWQRQQDWQGSGCKRLVKTGSAGGALDYLAPNAISNADLAQELHWPAREAALWGTWTGPTYVLTNGRTFSSAEMFAAVLQNNAAARIVGTRTGGDGCGFMNDPQPLTLPHSGLRFRIPNCVRLRQQGTDEVAGVTPDIPISPMRDESARARAVRLLALLISEVTVARR